MQRFFEPFKNWWRKQRRRKSGQLKDTAQEEPHEFKEPRIEGDFKEDGLPVRLARLTGALKKLGSKQSFNRSKLSEKIRKKGASLKEFELSKVSEHSKVIRWGLIILAIFLASEVVTRIISLAVRPVVTQLPKNNKRVRRQQEVPDFNKITKRNMFNVEGKIPEPFDQGMLDCFSQAKKSTQPITLLATIVMRNEDLSVALVQEGGNPKPDAARKNDTVFGKYIALKVERQRFCFQVKSTQDLEYIEVKDDVAGLMGAAQLTTGSAGIQARSETEFSISKSLLDSKLTNLNEILQTARAVPYIEGGNFKGFLIQSIRQDSVFFELGIRQGDVLTGVNDIQLDNAGKGLEAFQRLRNSAKVNLQVTRGGQNKTITYTVQ